MYLSQRVYKEASGPDYSFTFKREEQAHFYDKYHHHPEFELTYIEKGKGIRFVGDHIAPFKDGDMVLLGPNLSHMWKCDRPFYEKSDRKACCSYVIHFPNELLANMLTMPEMIPIRHLLDKSKRGIKIEGKIKDKVIITLKTLAKQPINDRLFIFLQLLHAIASSKNLSMLSQTYISEEKENKQSERLNAIYNHLLENIEKKITLQEVANISNMSPTAFCRFIKQKTGKSFTNLLNEIRINHACRLLTQSTEKIAQVAFSSGFNNLSHFNKQFKAITGKSPRKFLSR